MTPGEHAVRFPGGFCWGASTSAYQIEGGVAAGGRGPSIWDTFSHTPGRVRGGQTGDVACDHYHRWAQDVDLLGHLGVGGYRFSVAWPRVQPSGKGPANQEGLDFYRRLVEALVAQGIEPVATLYHWDLPQALEDEGGWRHRDTAGRFADYAEIVARAIGADAGVRTWITVNEPQVAAWLGYALGVHAPGGTSERDGLAATHHLLLAHGMAAQALRAVAAGDVGIALNLYACHPADPEDSGDRRAADLADEQLNRLYLDPVFGRGYPRDLLDRYAAQLDLDFLHDGDTATIAAPVDFLGVNYYTTLTLTGREPADPRPSELPASLGVWSTTPPGAEVTGMGWPIRPAGLGEVLSRVDREYAPAAIMVTENGAAFADAVSADGEVHDPRRVAYLDGHIRAAGDAVAAGVPLRGYFVWSLLDNFEWSQGYDQRFGVVRVDFDTQVRTLKDSGRWYRALCGAV